MSSSVDIRIDSVCAATRPDSIKARGEPFPIVENKENIVQLHALNAGARKRTRLDASMNVDASDDTEETPRARSKRQRQSSGFGSLALARSEQSEDAASEIGSHCSERYSPIKQLEKLKDAREPMVFCNLDDPRYTAREDVINMCDALDALIDQRAAFGYEHTVL